MILPFSQQRKAKWHLGDRMDAIEWAIQENDPFHFSVAVKDLYPVLEEYGVIMPRIEPMRTGAPIFDETWFEYHLFFLKELRRNISKGTFDLAQWNQQVVTNDRQRHASMEKEREYYKTRGLKQ